MIEAYGAGVPIRFPLNGAGAGGSRLRRPGWRLMRRGLVAGTVLSLLMVGAWSVIGAATLGPGPAAASDAWHHPLASYLALASAPTGNGLELFAVVAFIYAMCLFWRAGGAPGGGLRCAGADNKKLAGSAVAAGLLLALAHGHTGASARPPRPRRQPIREQLHAGVVGGGPADRRRLAADPLQPGCGHRLGAGRGRQLAATRRLQSAGHHAARAGQLGGSTASACRRIRHGRPVSPRP